jgi:pyruvate-ferredoxin/flavodoxin oxidoreductase
MQKSAYSAMVCGDGGCAGCGEKSVLRSISSLTEAYMRPLYHAKADRLRATAQALKANGVKALDELQKNDADGYTMLRKTIAHLIFEKGGDDEADTNARMEKEFNANNQDMVAMLVTIMEQDAFNHKDLQTIEGTDANGMSVMGMAACTGCNSVYGSTPPANPHTYPWMNSLFQDGPTIGWLLSEAFNQNHARRSVLPERIANMLLGQDESPKTAETYHILTHFTDAYMTEQEINEMPKVWAIGGDGALGDIGFQNLSKTILQNRPNYACLLLDTQVYSNTGGQNSDSSVMPGGFDMNQFGAGSQGKLTEKKEVAQILCVGHGSPYIAQVSMANPANLFKSIVDILAYRGTGFIQAYTPCMPEHGIGDNMASVQSLAARDSRGMPEFTFDSTLGETDADCLNLKANPQATKDWATKVSANKEKYLYTVAHWAATESRFRNHIKKAPADIEQTGVFLEDILWRVSQNDVVTRRVFDESEMSYVPDYQVYFKAEQADGSLKPMVMSRLLVLWCIERRKNWRKLQSRAGIVNEDYQLQRQLLSNYAKGEITKDQIMGKTSLLIDELRKTPVTA